MAHDIRDFCQSGSWTTSYSRLYSTAYHFFREFKDNMKDLESEKNRLREVNAEMGSDLESFVSHETRFLENACYRSANAALLFGCMSFEGFLNHYGSLRLGHRSYKEFVERKGITEKIAILFGICFSKIPDPKDEIIKRCRRLFEERNALAHPKSKTVDLDKDVVCETGENLSALFDDLEFCIGEFCRLDPSIKREFHFDKAGE